MRGKQFLFAYVVCNFPQKKTFDETTTFEKRKSNCTSNMKSSFTDALCNGNDVRSVGLLFNNVYVKSNVLSFLI